MKTVYLSVRLKNYENALALVGAPLAETPENADVLLLPGGGDMHPRFYGQALNGSEDLDEARDARELTLIDNFLCAGKPVIGICRGLQVLNVYFGGTLRQHIEGHSQIDGVDRLHAITTAPGLLRELYGTRCTVNSAHHQAAGKLGAGLIPLCVSDDGINEGFIHKNGKVIGVQFHPERIGFAHRRPDAVNGEKLFRYFLSLI